MLVSVAGTKMTVNSPGERKSGRMMITELKPHQQQQTISVSCSTEIRELPDDMTHDQILLLTLAIGAVAFFYSSVGHAGASGYIAVLTLAELDPETIRPTALALNILVASIAAWQFARRGYFQWELFWPFAILAVPMAFVGGYVSVPTEIFKAIAGLVLLISAFRFLCPPRVDAAIGQPSLLVSVPAGAGLGLLAGLTGTGGGIFLTPLLLTMRWASARIAAGVSAAFILSNSIAGLLGNFTSTRQFPLHALPFAAAAVVAGFAGSHFGSRRFPHTVIRRMLAAVLLFAGTRLLISVLF